MNDILKYYINVFSNATQSLKKQAIFLDKPWALIDEDGAIQKLIFKRDKGLIISKNGKVVEGTWDYFPEAKALLIDRGTDKLLLSEQFIDENVLILKKDGTQNDFFALANENTIKDYNVPRYLNVLKNQRFYVGEKLLLNGNTIQIHGGLNTMDLNFLKGRRAEFIDNKCNPLPITEGAFVSNDKSLTYYVHNGVIKDVFLNKTVKSKEGFSFEIEGGNYKQPQRLLYKKVTINGIPVDMERIVTDDDFIFELKQSVIYNIRKISTYKLSNGYSIKIDQSDTRKFNKGDRIIHSEPIYPIPDGKYRIAGTLFSWIKVENSLII